MVTNSAPRFAIFTSCGLSIDGYLYLRKTKLIRQYPLQGGRDLRCLCSNVSVSEPVNSETSSSPVKKRIDSGVQPTGSIHLGNYLGAIKNWIRLQDTYETFFFIVDLHAITLQYDAQQLLKATRDTAAIYLACGVDPSKSHVELMWLLSSATPIGWLNRMIQFKEKSRKVMRYYCMQPCLHSVSIS